MKEAVPENARVPAEILVGDDFDFPVHDVIPRKTEKEEKEESQIGGITEISFSEEDLMKNALSRPGASGGERA